MKRLLFWVILFSPVTIFAQDIVNDDFGAWTSLVVKGSKNNFYGDLRFERRSQNGGIKDLECWFIRPTIGYRLTDWLSIESSYYYINKPSSICHRTLLGFKTYLKDGAFTFSLTERWQYHYIVATSSSINCLRSKPNISYSISNSPFKPYIAFELFTAQHWNETRHYTGTSITINDHHSFEIFYQYRLRVNMHQEHIIGLGYIYSI